MNKINGIIYKHKVVNPGFTITVVDGKQEDIWFDPKQNPNNCRGRTEPMKGGIIHHQGGEGGAHQCYRVLASRKLSVHFQIDQKGLITQYADLNTVCKHAGKVNDWTWGVEISNKGVGSKGYKKFPRPGYRDTVHGQRIDFLGFYKPQKEACLNLIRAIHNILDLEIKIPTKDGKVIRELATKEIIENNTVFGHYMVSKRKVDPSPDLLDFILLNTTS